MDREQASTNNKQSSAQHDEALFALVRLLAREAVREVLAGTHPVDEENADGQEP